MKEMLFASSLVLIAASNASAQAQNNIQDHYKEVIVQKPYTVEVCTQGNGKSKISNFLEGAIIGGIIGNNIPGESGGGALGAIVGGALNAESNDSPQCRTETRYEEERKTIYSHSTINFYHDGKSYTLKFNK